MRYRQTGKRWVGVKQQDDRSRWRTDQAMSAGGLAAVLVAGLIAAVAVNASAASGAVVISIPAKGGAFHAGRVTLRGVSGRTRYVTDAGRAGTVSLRWLHRRVFLPGKPPTGMLHIAGRRHDLTLRLSNPRYTGSRGTASYTVKPLRGRSRLRAPVTFGDASLTLLPNHRLGAGGLGSGARGPGLGDNGGHDCEMTVSSSQGTGVGLLSLVSDSQWPTDDWFAAPATGIADGYAAYMASLGGFLRGCYMQAVYSGDLSGPVTITLVLSWPWSASSPTTSCTLSDPSRYKCSRDDVDDIGWDISGPK